ncbi:hypothetical protein ABZ858_29640 [Streptomyces sp. NPDC047017]|uniref:hypothetical protein n=1 Tax=Streptomyces sp. NPDC047017 TaxID=3155024 RepID=UPI00340C27F1
MSGSLRGAAEFLLGLHHVLAPLTVAVVCGVCLPRALTRSPWAHRTPRCTLALWGLLALALTASTSLAVLQLTLPLTSGRGRRAS